MGGVTLLHCTTVGTIVDAVSDIVVLACKFESVNDDTVFTPYW